MKRSVLDADDHPADLNLSINSRKSRLDNGDVVNGCVVERRAPHIGLSGSNVAVRVDTHPRHASISDDPRILISRIHPKIASSPHTLGHSDLTELHTKCPDFCVCTNESQSKRRKSVPPVYPPKHPEERGREKREARRGRERGGRPPQYPPPREAIEIRPCICAADPNGGDPRVWRRGPIKSTLLVQVRETSEVIPSITYDLAFIRIRINACLCGAKRHNETPSPHKVLYCARYNCRRRRARRPWLFSC